MTHAALVTYTLCDVRPYRQPDDEVRQADEEFDTYVAELHEAAQRRVKVRRFARRFAIALGIGAVLLLGLVAFLVVYILYITASTPIPMH